MSSHFQVGTWISCSRPPGFRCSAFACWQFGHLAKNSALSFFIPFPPIYFTKAHGIFLSNLDEWCSGTYGLPRKSGPLTHLPWEQTIFLCMLRYHPPKENSSLSFLRTDSLNSINDLSRCCLDFTSTSNDDWEL